MEFNRPSTDNQFIPIGFGEKNCIPMSLPQSATFHIQIDERKMNAGLNCQNASIFKR